MTDAPSPLAEMTPQGQQTLVPGVRPVTMRDRLDWLARQPMAPKRNPNARQKPCDICSTTPNATNSIFST